MHPFSDLARSLAPLVRATAREAGAIAKGFFRRDARTSARIWSKAGGSPVTEADVEVDAFLKTRLAQALPEAGWLSEETADDKARLDKTLVWIVDPIDGTRAFLAGVPDWVVAVALLANRQPVFGLVYAPASDALYEAIRGGGATRNGERIAVSGRDDLGSAMVAGPKPLVDRLEREVGGLSRVPKIPSLALRLVRVAEGSVDAGLVSANARDWDIAAADLILAEAGGRLTTLAGAEPAYNLPEPVHGELAAAPLRLHRHVLQAMTRRWQAAATSP